VTDGIRIAVVDDDALTATWLSEHLRSAGYSVETASTGAAALALVQQTAPALMLLDLRLPDASGLELLELCRKLDRDL
jgi:DNA-binding response OmpR family regulator